MQKRADMSPINPNGYSYLVQQRIEENSRHREDEKEIKMEEFANVKAVSTPREPENEQPEEEDNQTFTNDPERAFQWLKAHGAIKYWHPKPEELTAVNRVANACMEVYRQHKQPTDKRCIGWFPFSEVFAADGSHAPDHYRHADGMCICLGDDNKCAIGIRTSILKQNLVYAAVGVGLHETSHMRYDDHDDDFVSFLLTLQHDFTGQADNLRAQG